MKQHFGKYLGATLIDEAEPITAWRTWRLARAAKAGPIRLTGTWATDWTWAAGSVTVAECRDTNKRECNVAMRPDCNCGLWAAASVSNLLEHGAVAFYPAGALGRVRLWGFVHVYEFGFRASMGRPHGLWLGNSEGKAVSVELAAAYGCDVELGVPLEAVADPRLLEPAKVLKAAKSYQLAHSVAALPDAARFLRTVHGGRNLRIPASRRKRMGTSAILLQRTVKLK